MNKTRNHLLCFKRKYGLMDSPYPLSIEQIYLNLQERHSLRRTSDPIKS